MLWRVRTTLADRPGSLAELARSCGAAKVNILGLQIFPEVTGVTDELVLRTPGGWTEARVAGLVESAGGADAAVSGCSEHALVDPPTRYLHAVRSLLHDREDPATVLAELLDAELVPVPRGPVDAGTHRWGGELAGRQVELRRGSPFAPTEQARAVTFAQLVSDLADRGALELPEAPVAPHPGTEHATDAGVVTLRPGTLGDADALVRMHGRCSVETVRHQYGTPLARLDLRLARRLLTGGAGAVVAISGGEVVGFAALTEVEEGVCTGRLAVEDGRQRQGIGTRLLGAATRRAGEVGAEELLLRGPAESAAVIATVFGSGLRARVRLHGDELQVRVSTRGLATAARPATRSAPLTTR